MGRSVNAITRYMLVYGLSGAMLYFIVNEYPKSGGSWLAQMLADLLQIPFPRNRLPVLRPSIMHGHFFKKRTMKNIVLLWRDGRDVIVSWYFHCMMVNELGNKALVEEVRKDIQFEDVAAVRENLPKFIEYSFTRQRHPSFTWSEFVRAWAGRENVLHVRYEDLRSDPQPELARLVKGLVGKMIPSEVLDEVVYEYSFEELAKRKAGEEKRNSFLRKGIVGDWRNVFTGEAREIFAYYAGEELIQLGYERNSKWVSE